MTEKHCHTCVHYQVCGIHMKHYSPEKPCIHYFEGDPHEAQLEVKAFHEIAHKVIDMKLFEAHHEELKSRQRAGKLADIETIAYVTMGKIAVLRDNK